MSVFKRWTISSGQRLVEFAAHSAKKIGVALVDGCHTGRALRRHLPVRRNGALGLPGLGQDDVCVSFHRPASNQRRQIPLPSPSLLPVGGRFKPALRRVGREKAMLVTKELLSRKRPECLQRTQSAKVDRCSEEVNLPGFSRLVRNLDKTPDVCRNWTTVLSSFRTKFRHLIS